MSVVEDMYVVLRFKEGHIESGNVEEMGRRFAQIQEKIAIGLDEYDLPTMYEHGKSVDIFIPVRFAITRPEHYDEYGFGFGTIEFRFDSGESYIAAYRVDGNA